MTEKNRGKVVSINGNLVAVEFDGYVSMNEICFVKVDGAALKSEVIRIRGKAEFLGEEAVKKALEIMPALEQMIRPGNLEVFAVTDGTAVIADLGTGDKKEIKF